MNTNPWQSFFFLVCQLFFAAFVLADNAYSGERPNFLIMMADDLGYSDLSCFSSQHTNTPRLDRLCSQGMKFTDFYAAAPNCSPSRAGMLTGRFPARVGMYSYVPGDSPMHLPESETTTAELLKAAGYQTVHIGKWHLCSDLIKGTRPTPKEHGFDSYLATENNAIPSHANPTNFVKNGKLLPKQEGYSCDLLVSEAMNWLNDSRQSDKPFFMNLWFHEPHAKVAAPPELVAKHQGSSAVYYACIENMDRAIGRLLDELERLKLNQNTFILFTSDNGSYKKSGSNEPLRASKSFVWEGGIREPTMMVMPGVIPKNSSCSVPCGGVDLLATICQLAGIEKPQDRVLDGVSLVPLFTEQPINREKPLIWFFYRTDPACALRENNWSLVGQLTPKVPKGHSFSSTHMKYLRQSKLTQFQLFDLSQDISQQKDVLADYPEVAKRLSQKMIELHQEVLEEGPLWKFD